MEQRTDWIHIRVTPSEAKAVEAAAQQRGAKVSTFARAAIVEAATNSQKPDPRPSDARQTTARQ